MFMIKKCFFHIMIFNNKHNCNNNLVKKVYNTKLIFYNDIYPSVLNEKIFSYLNNTKDKYFIKFVEELNTL